MIKTRLKIDAFALASKMSEAFDTSLSHQERLEHLAESEVKDISDLFFSVVEAQLLEVNELDMVAQ